MGRLVFTLAVATSLVAQIRMPAFERTTLDNGAVVYLMPKKDLPLVTMRVFVRGGAESDPAGLEGLADVTFNMLSRGTAKRTREQLAEDLDQLGASMQAGSNHQAGMVQLQFLAKDFSAGVGILEEALLTPGFDDAELKRNVARRIDSFKVMKDQPQMAINRYLQAFYFGPRHPYGRSPQGTEASLARITRDAVLDFYKKTFVGKNLVIAVGGDIDPKTALAQVRAAFGKVPAGKAFVPASAEAPKRGESRLLLVDLPGATQTYFAIAQPGISRTSPDRVRVDLINTLFGGRFTSMLNDALRVESGLTYGARSTVQQDRLAGAITISTFTKTESTVAAIDLALKQLEKLQVNGINAEQLASAKAYVKGVYPTTYLETIDQLLNMLMDFEYYGFNRSEVDDLISRIDSVTLEQANEAARRYYQTGGLTFVLVGDAAKIRQSIEKYSKSIQVIKASDPLL
jgi:predicted Zn-dependent peptidase